MFTGLIEAMGTVRRVEPGSAGRKMGIAETRLARESKPGDSIAINGACLTVVGATGGEMAFEAGPETLERTNLGELVAGDRVNLERALKVSDRLGGHFVQGHVDGVARLAERRAQGEWQMVWFNAPPELLAQAVPKGSIAVDGISLTLVDVEKDRFSVALIPHTLDNTTLGFKPIGARVNIETDLLGKYVWKYLRETV
jgi:riboflavin synthase